MPFVAAVSLAAAAVLGAAVAPGPPGLGPNQAVAQTEDGQAEGRALFEEGMREAAANNYGAARGHLSRAVELYPHSSIAYNLALILFRMSENVAAVDLLDRVLNEEFGVLPPERIQEVEALRLDAIELTGVVQVSIEGAPWGRVRFDGESAEKIGRNESVERRLDRGEHRLLVTSQGYVTHEQTLVVVAGEEKRVVVPLSVGDTADRTEVPIESDVHNVAPSRHRRRRILAITLTAAVLIAGGVAVYFLVGRDRAPMELTAINVAGW